MYLLGFKKCRGLLMLSFICFLIIGGCSTKTENRAGIYDLDNDTSLVQGTTVRIDEDYIIVKYSPQKRLLLETDNNMQLEGFPSLRALKLLEPVKIRYRAEGGRYVIISIAKMADVEFAALK